MRRREFLITLVLSATMPCAHAQQPGKLYRIAIVSPSAPVAEMTDTGIPTFSALFKELRRLGYVEGQTIVVERYSGAGRTEHYSELANEVVRHKPDLIVTITSRMVLNFKAATTAIPIVGLMADPVTFGIVESLAHPGAILQALVRTRGPRFGASVSTCCAKPLREHREWDSWLPALCGSPPLVWQA
jgi:putative ABC transport system substrate-binding protein